MKKILGITVAVALVMSNVSSFSADDDKDKAAKKAALNRTQNSINISANGNYKHVVPTSKGNRFKDSFKKASPEAIERNYKKQKPLKKADVKNNSNISTPAKKTSSYKHPQGL